MGPNDPKLPRVQMGLNGPGWKSLCAGAVNGEDGARLQDFTWATFADKIHMFRNMFRFASMLMFHISAQAQ